LWKISFVCFATFMVQNLPARGRKTEKNKEVALYSFLKRRPATCMQSRLVDLMHILSCTFGEKFYLKSVAFASHGFDYRLRTPHGLHSTTV
jgi:hypothetical protein